MDEPTREELDEQNWRWSPEKIEKLWIRGKTARVIALELGCTVPTVKKYVRIFKRRMTKERARLRGKASTK